MEEVKTGEQPAKTQPEPAAATQPRAPSQKNKQEPGLAKKSPADPIEPPKLQLRNRHDVAFRHDVFRSDNKECLRNVSYKDKQPELIKEKHAHVFHSHSNNGKKNQKTGAALGHWHNVEVFIDPATGFPAARCGQAMHEVTTMTQSGRTVTRIEPVSFEKEVTSGEDDGKIIRIMDDHTHVLEYLGSEDLTPSGIANALKAQQGEAAAMGIHVGGIQDKTPAPMLPTDGASIT